MSVIIDPPKDISLLETNFAKIDHKIINFRLLFYTKNGSGLLFMEDQIFTKNHQGI